MAQITKLMDIGIIVFSFIGGYLFFYYFTDGDQASKKKQLTEITSQLINFIIFIWLGKIVWNLLLFIEDPLAVLAYPSDSKAFYFACGAVVITVFYQVKKNKIKGFPFIYTFLYVFLATMLTYEFIQFVIFSEAFSFFPFLLYFALIILILAMRTKVTAFNLLFILVTAWTIGMFFLLFTQPFVTIFDFTIHFGFILVVFIASLVSFGLYQKNLTTKD